MKESAFPAWLAQRFDPQGAPWDGMSDDDRAYWEHQAAAVRRAVARGGFKEAQPKSTQVVEYGVRVPGSAWPADGVLLDGDTFDRADQEARLERYRCSWPNAELVQRSVCRGEWTEAAS